MKYIFVIIISILILSNCKTDKNEKLSINTTLKNDFTTSEIESLSSLLTFFDNLVIERTGRNDIDSAYYYYMKIIGYPFDHEKFADRLLVNEREVEEFINSFKNDTIFNELWNMDFYIIYPSEKDSIVMNTIEPTIKRKYFTILNNAILFDSVFYEYKNAIWNLGGISPTHVRDFQTTRDRLNFDNEIIRLIVASHYITVIKYYQFDRIKNQHTTKNIVHAAVSFSQKKN